MKLSILLVLITTIFSLHVSAAVKSSPFYAATASVDATPPVGVPLAGFGGGARRNSKLWDWGNKYPYASYLNPSQGILDPIRSKVFLLQKGQQRLLFISLDVIGITDRFIKKGVMKRLGPLGFAEKDIFVGATHTHAGPGTLTKNKMMQIIAVDKFKKEIFEGFMDRIYESVILAMGRLAPATLHTYSFEAVGLQRNRADKTGHFDSRANILLAKNSFGEWLGGIINFSVHGTALGSHNMKYSADIAGAIEREFENRLMKINIGNSYRPTMAFFNGAEGDVAPGHTHTRSSNRLKEFGDKFSDQAFGHFDEMTDVEPVWYTHKQRIKLNLPKFNLKSCIGKHNSKIKKFLWKSLNVPVKWLITRYAVLSTLRLGHLTMLSWPGEPTTDIGFELQEASVQKGHVFPWLLTMTNDHLFYFTNKKEFQDGRYAACNSLYNWKGAEKIINAHEETLEMMNEKVLPFH